jgi:predicted MPP superfamily phosphohydrolase
VNRIRTWLRPTIFAGVGAVIALALAGHVGARIGPFDTTVAARPSLTGETTVRLAPLGSIELDTHDAPLGLEVRVDELRLEEAEQIARDPAVLDHLEDEITADVRRAMWVLALRCVILAVVGGAIGAFVGMARPRALLAGAVTGGLLALTIGALVSTTFDGKAVAEPRYSGLLTVAPTAVGDVESVVDRLDLYQEQLTELVGNVVTLYRVAQGLPTFDPDDGTLRILHVSDIHLNPAAFDLMDLLVEQFDVDAVADTGDVTDWGTEPETRLVERIGDLDVPYIWIRGNHDSRATQRAVAAQPNAVVLDGDSVRVAGLRFWGIADTRYTPSVGSGDVAAERAAADAAAPRVARMLRDDEPPAVDVAMVHDPRFAADLGDEVPLVLAGHLHRVDEQSLGSTTVLIEGSTGGAGLRSLHGDAPEPLTCSVLYFDARTRRLVAYDRITVRGLGETGARIERHVVEDVDDSEHGSDG